jgi:hypothetical protein
MSTTELERYKEAARIACEILAYISTRYTTCAADDASKGLTAIHALLHPEPEYEEVEVVRLTAENAQLRDSLVEMGKRCDRLMADKEEAGIQFAVLQTSLATAREAKLAMARLILKAHEGDSFLVQYSTEPGICVCDGCEIARKALAALPTGTHAAECLWTYDDDADKWDTDCGEAWTFGMGGPTENRMTYCHGCGKRVKVNATTGEKGE